MRTSFKKHLSILLLSLATAGCVGDQGDEGDMGEAGPSGAACWDKDQSGMCEPGSEDVDGDGTCSVGDCTGKVGAAGTACWDLDTNSTCDVATEDKNNSGACDVDDCAANGNGYILNGTYQSDASIKIGGSATMGLTFNNSQPVITALANGLSSSDLATFPVIQVKVGSPATRVSWLDNQGGLVAAGHIGYGLIPASGEGSRMMWHPGKAAFRAGGASYMEWDDVNIGYYSFAGGSSTKASAFTSVALGDQAKATGVSAVAVGKETVASGIASFAAGAYSTATGNYSVALGHHADASPLGAFVFADSTNQTVSATANNQFLARASGGVRFYTNAALSAGVTLAPGGSSWQMVSDRNMKTAFATLDGEDILAKLATVEVSSWVYKEEVAKPRHIGPMAQDFYAAFGLGTSDTSVNSLDLDGVNMAAVQALELRTRELAQTTKKVADLEAEVTSLRDDLERLEKLVIAQQQHVPSGVR